MSFDKLTISAKALTPDPTINEVVFRGANFSTNVKEAVTSAKISMSITEVTELTVSVEDPNFVLLGKQTFHDGTSVVYDDLSLEVTGTETGAGGSGLGACEVTARSVVVQRLKRRRGALVMRNVSPSQFIEREAKVCGAGFFTQPSGRRSQVSRDTVKAGESYGVDIPSSWTTFQRLAKELGYIVFEVANVIYFGKPSWLLAHISGTVAQVKVTWNSDQEYFRTISPPVCRRSSDSTDGTSVSGQVPLNRARDFRPGKMLSLGGVPTFDGKYMITSVSFPLAGNGFVDFEAKTVLDPKPEPPPPPPAPAIKSAASKVKPSTLSTPSTNGGTKSALLFTSLALAQRGDRYVFGAEASLSNPNPSAFDCSELVQWAAARAGLYMPDGSANQLAYCQSHGTMIGLATAARLRGALLFHPGHVAISLGNGKTIEAANPKSGVTSFGIGNRFTAAGKIPGMRF